MNISASCPAEFASLAAVADFQRYLPERIAKDIQDEGPKLAGRILERLACEPSPPSAEQLLRTLDWLQALEDMEAGLPLETNVAICQSLWRLLSDAAYGYAVRRGLCWHINAWLERIHSRHRAPAWHEEAAKARPEDAELLKSLATTMDARRIVAMIMSEIGRSRRTDPGVRDAERAGYVGDLMSLCAAMRYFLDASTLASLAEELSKQLDGRYFHLMLFARLMIVLIPRASAAKFVESGQLWVWWSALPEGLVPKFDLMWFAILARYAKQRWMSGDSETPVAESLSRHLPWVLNKAHRTSQLPLCSPSASSLDCAKELRAIPSADRHGIPSPIDALATGRASNWAKVAKFFVYSLAAEPNTGPEAAWGWLELSLRHVTAFLQPGGARGDWQQHGVMLLHYIIKHYFKRACRERLCACSVPLAKRLTVAADRRFIELCLPAVNNCLQRVDPMIMVQSVELFSYLAEISSLSSPPYDGLPAQLDVVDVPSVLGKAIEALNDPVQSGRHAALFQVFGRSLPGLLLRWPSFLNELLPVLLWGIDVTDLPKTVSSMTAIVSIFAHVPCVDIDNWSSVGRASGAPPDRRRWPAPPGTGDPDCDDPSSAVVFSSLLPNFAMDYFQRVSELIGVMSKPAKNANGFLDTLETVTLGLIHTTTHLIAAHCDKSTYARLLEALGDFAFSNLLVDQSKAVSALTAAIVRTDPATAVPALLPRLVKKLRTAGGSSLSADLSESEAKWYLVLTVAVVRHSGEALLDFKEPLQAIVRGALSDEREDVWKLGAKLLRRILFAVTATYVRSDFRICNEATWQRLLKGSGCDGAEWPLKFWGWTSPWWAKDTPAVKWHEATEAEVRWASSLVEGVLAQGARLLGVAPAEQQAPEANWLDGFAVPTKKGATLAVKVSLSFIGACLQGIWCWLRDGAGSCDTYFERFARVLMAAARSLSQEECSSVCIAGEKLPAGIDHVEVPGLLVKLFECLGAMLTVRGCRNAATAQFVSSNLRSGQSRQIELVSMLFSTDRTPLEAIHTDSRWRSLPRPWWVLEVADALDTWRSMMPLEVAYDGWRKDALDLLSVFAIRASTVTVRDSARSLLSEALPDVVDAKLPILKNIVMPALAEETKAVSVCGSVPSERADAEELRLNGALNGLAQVLGTQYFVSALWQNGADRALEVGLSLAECLYMVTRSSADMEDSKERTNSCEVKTATLGRVVVAMQRLIEHRDVQCEAAASGGFSAQRWFETMEVASQLLGICGRPDCHWRAQVMCTALVLALRGCMQQISVPAGKEDFSRNVWLQLVRWLLLCCEPKVVPSLHSLGVHGLKLMLKRPYPLQASDFLEMGLLRPSTVDQLLDVLPRQNHAALLAGGSGGGDSDVTAASVRWITSAAGSYAQWPHGWAKTGSRNFSAGNTLFWQSYIRFAAEHSSQEELGSLLAQASKVLAGKPAAEPEAHVAFLEMFAGAMRALRKDEASSARAAAWTALHPWLVSELQQASQERLGDWCAAVRFIATGTSQPQVREVRLGEPRAVGLRFLTPLFNFALNPQEAPSLDALTQGFALVGRDDSAAAAQDTEGGSSFVTFKRLRLLVALLAEPCAAAAIATTPRELLASEDYCSRLFQSLWPGLGHPYKQLREEAARSIVLLLNALKGRSLGSSAPLGIQGDIQDRLAQEAERLLPTLREDNASRSNAEAGAGEGASGDAVNGSGRKEHVLESSGICYVLLHAALARQTPAVLDVAVPRCLAFLLAAATHSDFELRVLASSALASCGAAHLASPVVQGDRPWHELSLARPLAGLLRSAELSDKEREKALFLAARPLLVANAYVLRAQPADKDGGRLLEVLRSLVEEALGSSTIGVRSCAKAAWATMALSDSAAATREHLGRFRKLAPPPRRRGAASAEAPEEVLAGVMGFSCLLYLAADLGAPSWVGEVVENIAPYGRAGMAEGVRTEVQGSIQMFLKSQQTGQEAWQEFQAKLTTTQLDLLHEYKGKLTYFS